MNATILVLADGADETTIQNWLDEHPNITDVKIAANGNYLIILYNE